MFLQPLRRRNPALIEQAIALHQAGSIPANAYVIDLADKSLLTQFELRSR